MKEQSIIELFQRGGGFMWPIFILLVITLILLVERLVYFTVCRYRVGKSLETLRSSWQTGDLVIPKSNPLLVTGAAFLTGKEKGEEHCLNVSEREAARRLNRHERGLRLLAIIGNIAPLVGLLGTVWGMVKAFAQIAELGDKVTPSDFADGVWTGLLTTVFGLVVAIPAVAGSRFFEGKVDQLLHDLNEVNSHLKEWVFGSANQSS